MKCPHCSEEIAEVVPRDRVNTKNAPIRELEAQLAEASPKRPTGSTSSPSGPPRPSRHSKQTRAEFEAFRSEADDIGRPPPGRHRRRR